MPYFILYSLACALVGLAGRHRRIGFAGFFLLSFFATPLIGILVVFLSAPVNSST